MVYRPALDNPARLVAEAWVGRNKFLRLSFRSQPPFSGAFGRSGRLVTRVSRTGDGAQSDGESEKELSTTYLVHCVEMIA